MQQVAIRRGKEQRLRGGHPWIYRPEIHRPEIAAPRVEPGEDVAFVSLEGEVLAHGYYNNESAIPGRVLSFGPQTPSANLVAERIRAGLALRANLGYEAVGRLVFSEADGLPGLILDRFDSLLVAQESTAGMQARRPQWEKAVREFFPTLPLFLRNQLPVRRKEGLEQHAGWMNEAEAAEGGGVAEIQCCGARFLVDPAVGQKTGFFLDQVENYARLRGLVRPTTRVLDLFAYQGAFAMVALRAGARFAVAVDSSSKAIEHMAENARRNDVESRLLMATSDVGDFLAAEDRLFDIVVLDPPPLAKASSDLHHAFRKYVSLNRAALRRVERGGLMMTFSCSEAVSWETLRKVLRSASRAADRRVVVVGTLTQSADHPVPVTFPEAEYLRGYLLAVD